MTDQLRLHGHGRSVPRLPDGPLPRRQVAAGGVWLFARAAVGRALLAMLRTVAGREETGALLWTCWWTEPSVQPVQSGPLAVHFRGIRAGSAPGATGRASHDPPVVGSSPAHPTCDFTRIPGQVADPVVKVMTGTPSGHRATAGRILARQGLRRNWPAHRPGDPVRQDMQDRTGRADGLNGARGRHALSEQDHVGPVASARANSRRARGPAAAASASATSASASACRHGSATERATVSARSYMPAPGEHSPNRYAGALGLALAGC
jgi:hypothetical protein